MLTGIRVVDRTAEIAGPYCTKLLADAGADVVKVEAPDGDPMRRWGSGALFEFLNTSKRSVVDDGSDGADLENRADVLVVDTPIDVDDLWRRNPALVVVTITPFGSTGPWAGRPATEFTLQAAAGSTGSRGLPDREPLAAGGRLGEWITGTYAALGAVAALTEAERSGHGDHVDVAMLDCMAVTMASMPSVFASFLGWLPMEGTGRTVDVPSVEPTADGYAVFTTNSAQQYEDFCLLIGRTDLLDDPKLARPLVRFQRRDSFNEAVHAWTRTKTTAEALEEAARLRIPSGPVLDGSTVPAFPQFVERGTFVPSPTGRFVQPRVPYQISGVSLRPFEAPPALGEQTGQVDWDPRAAPAADGPDGAPHRLPLDGVRVVDCTAWWAGPAATEALTALGADVVKVESVSRPDLMRYTSTKPPSVDQWWEWSPMFHGANAGKRGITLDLSRPEGIAVFERLVGTADLLVENFTPRVMEQFGLGWDRVHALNPRLVMLRMPAFGLDGPWRDHTGFAQTMECVAGMSWLTGFADGPPVLVRGACDPLAGMHAVIAAMLALRERDRTGEGRLVEAVMVEAALNSAAEQVVEFGAAGVLHTRDGNRGPVAAPQGVYRCAGVDRWVAIAVATDDQWRALRTSLGGPPWAAEDALDAEAGRRAAHDLIDQELERWTAAQDADDVADRLCAAGVPAAVVISSRDIVFNPQVRHRGLFEVEHHPITGDHELAGLPFRLSHVDRWVRSPAPVIGEHNHEVLTEAGLTADEIARLEEQQIIGTRPRGT